jgi:hypothetical protein
MRRQQQGALWQELLVFDEPKYRLPVQCKFGFHSVLANTLEHLGIQGLRSTSLSNRLPSYFEGSTNGP